MEASEQYTTKPRQKRWGNVIDGLLVFGLTGLVAWGGSKLFAAKNLEIGLGGKPKLKMPITQFNEKTKSNEALVPISVPIKLTNNTLGTLSFNHPTANIYYQGLQIAHSKPETKAYELFANKTVDMTIDFLVPVKEFTKGGVDAVQYFIGRFMGKAQPQRKLRLDTIVHAYGFTINEPLEIFI